MTNITREARIAKKRRRTPKEKTILVKAIPVRLHKNLKAYCKENKISMGATIIQSIEYYIERDNGK